MFNHKHFLITLNDRWHYAKKKTKKKQNTKPCDLDLWANVCFVKTQSKYQVQGIGKCKPAKLSARINT